MPDINKLSRPSAPCLASESAVASSSEPAFFELEPGVPPLKLPPGRSARIYRSYVDDGAGGVRLEWFDVQHQKT